MITTLPARDGRELAEARRRELDLEPGEAMRRAHQAIEAMQRGWYVGPQGEQVHWREAIDHAVASKSSIPGGGTLPRANRERVAETLVCVANETTLAAARELRSRGRDPLALNFANGIEPGGGFLRGARAQEEALCRSSALYATLHGDPMYEAHRKLPAGESSAWCIVSPDVPVFRADDGAPLAAPWLCSFVTCAAPYEPVVGAPRSALLLHDRIHRVLEVASAHGYDSLVLGAWGCGAFGNHPTTTAKAFRTALESDLGQSFGEVVFAICDWSPERRFLQPFRDVFGG
jgi:uncharacterized protein (TIGR02452 family)